MHLKPNAGTDRLKLTPAEREKLDVELGGLDVKVRAQVSEKLDQEMKVLSEAKLDRLTVDATKWMDSPGFKNQMEHMQREIAAATAKIDSPEFRKQLELSTKVVDDVNLKLKLELAQNLADNHLTEQSEQLNREMSQLDSRLSRLDDPEIKRSIEQAQKMAEQAVEKVNSPEFKRQIEDMQKRVANGDLHRQMDAAQRALKAAEEQLKQLNAK